MPGKKTRYSTLLLVCLALASQFAPPSWRNALLQLLSLNSPADRTTQANQQATSVDQRLLNAIAEQKSKVWFEESLFTVIKLLADDNHGSRHQRFLVTHQKLPTLLVAHNIDLANRVPIQEGQQIHIRGRYEWNKKGGVIHWTHHDPKGHIQGGWIRDKNKTYR